MPEGKQLWLWVNNWMIRVNFSVLGFRAYLNFCIGATTSLWQRAARSDTEDFFDCCGKLLWSQTPWNVVAWQGEAPCKTQVKTQVKKRLKKNQVNNSALTNLVDLLSPRRLELWRSARTILCQLLPAGECTNPRGCLRRNANWGPQQKG